MDTELAMKKLVPINRQAACEGMVLLENKDNILPLQANDKLSVFGRCQINTYRSGTGSGGAVNVPYVINVLDGLRANKSISINEDLASIYADWVSKNPFDDGGGGWAAEPWFQHEMPLNSEIVKAAAEQSTKAMVIIGRTAGEDVDYSDEPGSYRLTELEESMIHEVASHFEQLILIFNTTSIIDMSWLQKIDGKDKIKAILYSWAAGMEGGHALADILSGDVSPSGRLTDTIAHNLDLYPSSANFGSKEANFYWEDIYLGYRYFSTFEPQAVMYPFGYGLSYTNFESSCTGFTIEGESIEQVLQFHLTVKNTGTHASKELVQIYCEAPQGKLGKPARVLAGFSKTDTLESGAETTIHISIKLASLASYDDSGITGNRSAMLLEAGDYKFYSGANVRDAELLDASVTLNDLLIVEQLSEAMAPVRAFDRLKPGIQKADGTYEKTSEAVPARTVDLTARITAQIPPAIAQTDDQGIKLADVKNAKASMEDFIAQLNNDDLASIIRGEGMCSPKVTPGTAAAFGGTTERLFNFGIPVIAAADGPSGIRMDSGHKASQVAIGTMLACTWNADLNEALFYAVGEELAAYKIDTLLGPGINIHRHPLNGRNFEYFSEDPYMTGVMAAAQTRGLAKAGVSGTIKHFAANDQETARHDSDSIMSERALREVNIKPFEMAVKEGMASIIMTSYNPVNGHWAASNFDLNTKILREEWGFTGLVMSDWWAKMNHNSDGGEALAQNTNYMIRAQNDLYMVVENDRAAENPLDDNTIEALKNSELSIGELQRCAMNICRFIMATPAMERPLLQYDPVKEMTSKTSIDGEVELLKERIDFNATSNLTVSVKLEEAAVYKLILNTCYDRHTAAQSSCSLYINGDFAMTLSVNGTEGKWIDVEGVSVNLEAGYYEFSIDFVKPGLELAFILFEKNK
ncbi:MAG: glycoside hydrolase family 3 C-terminal domain-containing protein [Lentisphaeria bacterium]|nr:glycoside hydrolase family 3 C-terminal domain-containing protein [Lentisphaeria bacterium]NQZ69695.1 glycoside hydrolase family 3 C-terminal domain-containing protein [Lentisphaeria bacterium]